MRKSKDRTSTSSGANGASYEALALAHIRAHGLPDPDNPGKYLGVILYGPNESGHAPEPWRAWMSYFIWLDGRTKPRGNKFNVWSKLRVITVPAAWPKDFDASAPPMSEPFPLSREPSKPWDREKEPWLKDAKWEIGANGRMICPGVEVDRAWRKWLADRANR